MTENVTTKKKLYSLKPILILTVAAILISKAQRTMAGENSSVTPDSNSNDNTVCPDYCNLPADRATRGKAPFRMWYFDPAEGGCKRFRWSGRGGNKNRFYKKADCEETCSKCTLSELMEDRTFRENVNQACSPSLDEGRCGAGETPKTPQLVWHYSREKANCSPFIFHGCGGNSNRFSSEKDCEDICE